MSSSTPDTNKRAASSASPGEKNARRKVSHISRACDSCRRRKIKCDARLPCCSGCAQYKEECSYDGTSDRRKPVSRDYVVALEERVRVLERTLRQNGVTESLSSASPAETVRASAALGSVASSQNRLQINLVTGELGEYGPTSAFKHASGAETPSGPWGDSHHREHTTGSAEDLELELDEPKLEHIVELFFSYFNPWCSYIEQDLFTRDLLAPSLSYIIKPRHRTPYYSPLLHHAMLSIGCRYLDGDRTRRERLSNYHIEQAKVYVDCEVEMPMLSTVSGLMVLSIALSGAGRQGLGWMYAGLGLRVALALGLGIDCSYCVGKLITEETKRSRDHLFYLAYISDKLWSFYVGRASSLSMADYETAVPDVVASDDAREWPTVGTTFTSNELWMVNYQAEGETKKTIPSLESTNFVWTCKLACIAEEVINTVYSIRLDTWSEKVRQVVSHVDVNLERWYGDLPQALRLRSPSKQLQDLPGHVLLLHATYYFVIILLHRPWYNHAGRSGSDSHASADKAAYSAQRCDAAASKIVEILKLYEDRPGLRYCGITLIQVAFAAGTVHLMKATRAHPHRRASATDMTEFDACMSALRAMSLTWKSASQSESILGQLREEWCPQELAPVRDEQTAAGGIQALLERNPAMVDELRRLGWAPPAEQGQAKVHMQGQGHMQLQTPMMGSSSTTMSHGDGLPMPDVGLTGQGVNGFQDMMVTGTPLDGISENSFDMPGMSFWETLFAPQNGAAGDGLSFPSAGGDLWSLNGRSG